MKKNPAEDKAEVKLVPCATSEGLKEPGGLAIPCLQASQVDEAFSEVLDEHLAMKASGVAMAPADFLAGVGR